MNLGVQEKVKTGFERGLRENRGSEFNFLCILDSATVVLAIVGNAKRST